MPNRKVYILCKFVYTKPGKKTPKELKLTQLIESCVKVLKLC